MATSASADLSSLSLNSSTSSALSHLKPYQDTRFSTPLLQYRNIPYATIAKRFEKPKSASFPSKQKDCTTFGPVCAQLAESIEPYFSMSSSVKSDTAKILQDELLCTNLNITVAPQSQSSPVPVLMWFPGGASMVSWPAPAHRLSDPGPLVAQAAAQGKPLILVTVSFRLNIFSFGTGEEGTEVNLILQDQLAAINWVKQHISKFGGDPQNITVAGESAGAINIHALLATGAKVSRAILVSGCLFTSPPQKDRNGFGLIGLIEGNLQLMEFDKGNTSGNFTEEATILGAKPKTLLQCLKDLQIRRMWFWDEPELKDWQNVEKTFGGLEAVMIGDCTDEYWYLNELFTKITAKQIANCFSTDAGQKLAESYAITSSMGDKEARQRALEFISDSRFGAWPTLIANKVNAAHGKTKAYQYLFDEPNPWTGKECGHAMDLLSVFGGYDADVNDETRKVGEVLRSNWIAFVNGNEPWQAGKVFGYGPKGKSGVLGKENIGERRRTKQLELIRELGIDRVAEVSQTLLKVAASTMEG